LNLNDKFLQDAIKRIKELQTDVIEQANKVKGADKYIEKQVKLYKQMEELKKKIKSIEKEEEQVTNNFFKNINQTSYDFQ